MTQWGLDNLFNPGKRHMDDEKRRLQSTREEIGDNSGGRRIDLEGGKVSIAVRRPSDIAVDDPCDPEDSEFDDTALDAALEAEDVPAVALANDEAEIVPELADEAAGEPVAVADPESAVAEVESPEPTVVPGHAEALGLVEAVATELPAAAEPVEDEPVAAEPIENEPAEDEPTAAADDVPIEAPEPERVAAAPRKKQLSASAWSRRG